MAYTLHPHQEQAVTSIFDYFADNDGNPLIVAPVGSGKSLMIAEFMTRAGQYYPGTNFVVLTHVAELLLQDAEHLYAQWPTAKYSFYCDKLKQKDLSGQIIFASISSIYKQAYKIPKRIDIILVDEAHLISPDEATMYQKIIKDLKVINADLKVIGFTGTAFRATEGQLTEGEGRIFTDIAHQIPMLYLIEKGYLCPLVTPPTRTTMSTKGVKTNKGDFILSQLQKAVDTDEITKACVDEIVEHGKPRRKWLVFTAGVEHCENVLKEIQSRGINAAMVTGDTPKGRRDDIVETYKHGDLQCLVCVGVFTTGFNNPAIDLIAFMRPTRSAVLYVQMAGRGMRIYPGKVDCLLLDFGGVIAKLGPIDLVDAKRVKGSGNGDAPVKLCPKCHATNFAGVHICLDCGHEFPDTGIELRQTASNLAAMSHQIKPEWFNVLSVSYILHQKAGKNKPTMQVTYNTLGGQFREWICFEHFGAPKERASKWVRVRNSSMPKTVNEAVSIKWQKPTQILVRPVGKYHEILDYKFD